MYSKAGKATYETFNVLQHAQDILEPKTLKLTGRLTPRCAAKEDKLADMVAKQFAQQAVMKNLAAILDVDRSGMKNDSMMKSPKSRRHRKFEPFGLNVSRDQREKVLSSKVVSSNAAYYLPKYDRIEKKSPAMVNYGKDSSKRLFDEIVFSSQANSPTNQSPSSLPPIADKPRDRVKGVIPLDLHISRPDILEEAKKKKVCLTDALSNPELPSTLSSVARLPRIKFSRTMSRKELVQESGASNCPVYNVNYEYVKKSLGRVGPSLDKSLGRKDLIQNSYYTVGDSYEYDDYVKSNKSQVYPKVIFPDFEKMPPREKDPKSKYPAYLQSLRSRLNDSVETTTKRTSPRSIDTSLLFSYTAVQTRI